VTQGLSVGGGGTSTLTIRNGGRVASGSGFIGIGAGTAGSATVLVTDPGSQWTVTQDLGVFGAGTGTLTIQNGGQVTSNTGTIGGYVPGSSGTVLVTGTGSRWTVAQDLSIGVASFFNGAGTGSLSIRDGGQVTSATGSVGSQPGSTGTVTVTDPRSVWSVTNILVVGGAGSGTLTIQNGGQVSSASGSIGSQAGSTGTVTVTDPGSQWAVTHRLSVGDAGTGTLSIQNGGRMSSADGFVGALPGASGTVTIMGAGSQWALTNILRLGLGPADAPGGTITLMGNYTQQAGVLDLEIAGTGAGQFDQFLIHGAANFQGGSIDISFINGFLPHAGDTFDFMLADLGITLGPGVTFLTEGVGPGFEFSTTALDGVFEFTALTNGQSVPEPPAILVWVGAGIVLAWFQFRRLRGLTETGSRTARRGR